LLVLISPLSDVWLCASPLQAYQIGQTFAAVFGQEAMLTQIRPIYADWPLFPDRYNATLAWFNATYGPPKK
jgi:hypothetical protein